MTSRRAPVGAIIILLLHLAGCQREMSADARSRSFDAFSAAASAMSNRDFAAAYDLYSQALASGGLDADHAAEAQLLRAVCAAHLGKYAEAHADLDQLEAHAPLDDRFYAARAWLLQCEGNATAAAAAMQKARALNPAVEPFQ